MAYYDENIVKNKAEEKKSRDISTYLFEEKEYTFGGKKISVRFPRPNLVNLLCKTPPMGVA